MGLCYNYVVKWGEELLMRNLILDLKIKKELKKFKQRYAFNGFKGFE